MSEPARPAASERNSVIEAAEAGVSDAGRGALVQQVACLNPAGRVLEIPGDARLGAARTFGKDNASLMPNTLTIDLPAGVNADAARLLLAIQLFEDERISLGKAAEYAGYLRRAFVEILGRRGVAVIDYDPDDLAGELSLDLGGDRP